MTLQQPPGWYPMPDGTRRWWDGRQWTAAPPPTPGAALTPVAQRPVTFAPATGYGPPPQPMLVANIGMKDVGVTYLLAILLGGFSAHRFYLGRIGSAIAQLLLWQIGLWTLWVFVGWLLVIPTAIWLVVDLFMIPGMVRESNHRRLAEHQHQYGMHAPGAPGVYGR